jgi:hypothetical protein
MEKDPDPKHWLQTLPGLLTATAGLIAAITALIVALGSKGPTVENSKKDVVTNAPVQTNSAPADGCAPPYVWRLAVPSDYVCVTEDSRKRVELENQRAAERRQASGLGSYGADTCLTGYVWREAFEGDTVCVLPERREEVRRENALALQRIRR